MVDAHCARSLTRLLPERTEFNGMHASLNLLTGLTLARIRYRGDDPEAWLAGKLHISAPKRCRETLTGPLSCAWLGPGEWLLSGPEPDVARLAEAPDWRRDEDCLITDITHGSAAFRLTGAGAVRLLAPHCPLDFGERSMPVGFAARTLFAETRMIICRRENLRDQRQFQLIVDQTMRDYAIRMLVG